VEDRRGIKRLRDDDETPHDRTKNLSTAQSKQKKRKKEKEKLKELIEGGWENIQDAPVEKQQSFFWLHLAKSLKTELSALELEDELSSMAFCSPDSVALHTRIRAIVPALRNPSNDIGKPAVLVFSRSTSRCYDVARLLFKLGTSVRVGQLFGNKKVAELQQQLNSSPCHVAVGTPERLRKLVESGALTLDNVKLIALDVSKDVKGYHLLDLHDTAISFYRFYVESLHRFVKEESLKLLLFT